MSDQLDLYGSTTVTDAVISDCGTYRYRLLRQWDASKPAIGWVMLNPSTADHTVDDPTIRRCIGFAKRMGYGGIVVRNLYALRATYPRDLSQHPDPVGPLNDDELALGAYNEPVTILAWGASVPDPARARHVTELLWRRSSIHGTRCAVLGWTKSGIPRHPLYLSGDTPLEFCDEGEVFDA